MQVCKDLRLGERWSEEGLLEMEFVLLALRSCRWPVCGSIFVFNGQIQNLSRKCLEMDPIAAVNCAFALCKFSEEVSIPVRTSGVSKDVNASVRSFLGRSAKKQSIQEKKKRLLGWGYSSASQHLPSKLEFMSLISGTPHPTKRLLFNILMII